MSTLYQRYTYSLFRVLRDSCTYFIVDTIPFLSHHPLPSYAATRNSISYPLMAVLVEVPYVPTPYKPIAYMGQLGYVILARNQHLSR